jgi:hypothetical protein
MKMTREKYDSLRDYAEFAHVGGIGEKMKWCHNGIHFVMTFGGFKRDLQEIDVQAVEFVSKNDCTKTKVIPGLNK